MSRATVKFVMSCLLYMAATQALYAERVKKLYEAATPVQSQSPEERSAALQDILRQVLVKLSGQTVLPERELAGVQPRNMVEQFGYQSRDENNRRQLYLWAKLNQSAVQSLARRLSLPVWPEERPATLVWVAVEDSGPIVLSQNSEHPVLENIRTISDRRGLPVIFPLMDLFESSRVDYQKIAAPDLSALEEVSGRYNSQYMLVGHVQKIDHKNWRARWHVVNSDDPVIITPAGPLQDIVAMAVDPLASRIAQQFSAFSNRDDPQYIDLVIDDIRSAADYARSMHYLQSLSPITGVEVISANGSNFSYRLHTHADLASVLKVISLDNVLFDRNVVNGLVYGLSPRYPERGM